MIDFRSPDKLKRRIQKFTVEEGDFYFMEISSAEAEEIQEENKEKDSETMLIAYLDKMMCNKEGELLHLKKEELIKLPVGLLRDITEAAKSIITGEKKS